MNEEQRSDHTENQAPDVLALMEQIRAKIKAEVESNKDSPGRFVPHQPVADGEARRSGELQCSEDLRALNRLYAYSASLDLGKITSHRPGLIGTIIVKAKRKLTSILWDSLLKDYFAAEREYQANLVRFLNEVGRYIDGRDAAIFSQLLRKIDGDDTALLERVERICDEQRGTMQSAERRIERRIDRLQHELQALGSAVSAGSRPTLNQGAQILCALLSGAQGDVVVASGAADVAALRGAGLAAVEVSVIQSDLGGRADGSLAAIVASSADEVRALRPLAAAKLKRGGMLIVPRSSLGEHEAREYASAGFEVKALAECERLSGLLLEPLALEPDMTPRLGETVERINHTISRLNRVLFGDLAVMLVARRR